MKSVTRALSVVLAAGLMAAASSTASAGSPEVRDLGFGWQVVLPDADLTDIVVDFELSSSSTLVIQKFPVFTGLSAFDFVFQQTGTNAGTASRIIITDELIINNTGQAWVQFTNELLNARNGSATFNVADTSSISISPAFTDRVFNDPVAATRVDFVGGPGVPNQGLFTPGLQTGALVIDVVLSGSGGPQNGTTFTLREVPAIPAPGSAALLAVAGLISARRRRA